MSTLLITHPASIDHVVPPGHPERPDRMRAVEQALSPDAFNALVRTEAPLGEIDHVLLCHNEHYVNELQHIAPAQGLIYIDGDTSMSPGTWEAVMRGVGGATAAIDAVVSGRATNAFVATRPPGHHAETGKPMGFCFFDHAAIAARYAQRQHGVGRVAVVDFDVHHGNGTQAAFEADPSLFLASIHQSPLYPGTGDEDETGVGNIVNAPIPPHAPNELWRRRFGDRLMPALDDFRPDLVLISAGFDAHRRDPLAHQSLDEADFAWATRAIVEVARRHARGRVVSTLEGGYDLEALGRSAVAHARALGED